MSTKNIGIVVILLIVSFFIWLPEPEVLSNKIEPSVDDNKITLITNVSLFDGDVWSNKMDVAFSDGFILEVGKSLQQNYYQANLIDGQNKFLLPGLIDAHTHAWGSALKDAAKFGVTTELDMFTNNAFAIPQREIREKNNADIQQADLFSAGTLVTSPNGHGTEYGFEIPTINNPNDANAFVLDRVKEGSDYIKIVYNATSRYMPSIDKATLQALIKSAHQQNQLAVVHISDHQSALDAIESGADGLVHSFMDKADMTLLLELMKRNNQFVIPTLSVLASMLGQNNNQHLIADFEQQALNISAEKIQLEKRIGQEVKDEAFNQAKQNVTQFLDAGILILAGTDAPNIGTAHGISLHGELELLVQSGLTPTQAIAAATSNPAKAFNLSSRGFIKKGMKADLLLLNKDPRVDVRFTRQINSIYKNGFLISTEQEVVADQIIQTAISLGDFNQDLTSSLSSQQFYSEWVATSDEMFKGNSTAKISRVDSIDDPYLQIVGEIKKQFSFPWAGAYLVLSQDNQVGINIAQMKSIEFKANGLAGSYRLLLFSSNQPMRPIELTFSVSNQWNKINLALDQVPSVLLESITGIAIVAGIEQHSFELNIDDVWLR